MKTTVELPEELLREAQAEASRRGLLLAEILAEALRRMPPSPDRSNAKPARLHLGAHAADLSALMADGEGIIDSGHDDLGSHPRHMKGFGRDALGHR